MTKQQESEILTRVGPGTPMGNVLRHYWFPALKSSELVPDGAPVRFLLLGEQLIAFRDTEGRIGIMDHRCPHRCASLFFGRNEDNGIRCVYHGWKYDYLGNCVDQPNLPPHRQFKEKVHAKAYRAAERKGVWQDVLLPRSERHPIAN
jgi:phthalate 4,5-dioxygenase